MRLFGPGDVSLHRGDGGQDRPKGLTGGTLLAGHGCRVEEGRWFV